MARRRAAVAAGRSASAGKRNASGSSQQAGSLTAPRLAAIAIAMLVATGLAVFAPGRFAKKDVQIPFLAPRTAALQARVELPCATSTSATSSSSSSSSAPQCGNGRCKRFVLDDVFPEDKIQGLVAMADTAFSNGIPSGGAMIFDLHSGAINRGEHFADVFRAKRVEGSQWFTQQQYDLYTEIQREIAEIVRQEFGATNVHLTKPNFFSRITNKSAVTLNDEYWHPHVDRIAYGSFDFTCLLYLTTLDEDFEGGAFCLCGWEGGQFDCRAAVWEAQLFHIRQ